MHFNYSGLAPAGICAAGCAAVACACYAAAGAVFGTVTVGVGTPAAIIACNAAFGKCMAACSVALALPTPWNREQTFSYSNRRQWIISFILIFYKKI